jgi:N-acetyl-gamma-glutamyl-phosphate reductase
MMSLETFTDRAKKVLQLANQEAQKAGREHVGAEHLLLGLLSEGRGVGAYVLKNVGVSLASARAEVERLTLGGRKGFKPTGQQLPLSSQASAVLERTRDESAALGHQYVGTEHLLLALLHDQQSVAANTMRNLGLDFRAAREEVVALLGRAEQQPQSAAQPEPIIPDRPFRVGIVGVSGFGGGEVLRLCASHPYFEVVYVSGESSAGQKLRERFPGIPDGLADLMIEKWNPGSCSDLDVLFASLPTGESRPALARVPGRVRVIDIGGDHRFVDGWTYGLADVWPERVRTATRIANPGCYPAAAITALAPLLSRKLIEPAGVIIDAKSGVSGAGRGGGSTFGFADVNEDLVAYGLLNHSHVPEMAKALGEIAGSVASITFTPHLVPMTRGLLATCYCRGGASTAQCLDTARSFYRDRAFVRVVDQPPHTKWAAGSNLAFVSYACDPAKELVIAMCVIDNLGKGAAGQAIQNANLMLGMAESVGLTSAPLWP